MLYARNNCLKASHNPIISCRRFGFRRFGLSPFWLWTMRNAVQNSCVSWRVLYSCISQIHNVSDPQTDGRRHLSPIVCPVTATHTLINAKWRFYGGGRHVPPQNLVWPPGFPAIVARYDRPRCVLLLQHDQSINQFQVPTKFCWMIKTKV